MGTLRKLAGSSGEAETQGKLRGNSGEAYRKHMGSPHVSMGTYQIAGTNSLRISRAAAMSRNPLKARRKVCSGTLFTK